MFHNVIEMFDKKILRAVVPAERGRREEFHSRVSGVTFATGTIPRVLGSRGAERREGREQGQLTTGGLIVIRRETFENTERATGHQILSSSSKKCEGEKSRTRARARAGRR